MTTSSLPVGKLPHDLLEKILRGAPTSGSRVLVGPGVGLDCAVLDFGATCLVLKTEPITFASDQLGWYAVQVAANDIATTGAVPKWAMFTVLLPENKTTETTITALSGQLSEACRGMGITVIGGHTEITHDLDRVIVVTTLVGEIEREKLITPDRARPGDVILLTKGVPIEGTAILAREFPDLLRDHLTAAEVLTAANYLFNPGISVLSDAQVAVRAGGVTAMHDPTEGGVATALWEMAHACNAALVVDPNAIPILPLAGKICQIFGLDPLGTIASGALLITVNPEKQNAVLLALHTAGIMASVIGQVAAGDPEVLIKEEGVLQPLPRYDRDEIGRVFQQNQPDKPRS